MNNLRKDELQRAATQAAIDYLYHYRRNSAAFQLYILARLLRTNGCTAAPDLCFAECCNAHDVEYRTGKTLEGKPTLRANSDTRFLLCMSEKAKKEAKAARVVAPIYYAAVRVFGESHWLTYTPPEARPEPLSD